MLRFHNLFDCLREYLKFITEHEDSLCYLTYNPRLAFWSFFDGTKTDETWNAFCATETITILRLEPDAANAALRVVSPSDLTRVITTFAAFTAGRPHSTGLHHFITVDPPDSIKKERLEEPSELPT